MIFAISDPGSFLDSRRKSSPADRCIKLKDFDIKRDAMSLQRISASVPELADQAVGSDNPIQFSD